MTNDDIRMTKEWRKGNEEGNRQAADCRPLDPFRLVIRHCRSIRHSCFVIRHWGSARGTRQSTNPGAWAKIRPHRFRMKYS
jgi:hypothetical protein